MSDAYSTVRVLGIAVRSSQFADAAMATRKISAHASAGAPFRTKK